jgi:hypothetical protein
MSDEPYSALEEEGFYSQVSGFNVSACIPRPCICAVVGRAITGGGELVKALEQIPGGASGVTERMFFRQICAEQTEHDQRSQAAATTLLGVLNLAASYRGEGCWERCIEAQISSDGIEQAAIVLFIGVSELVEQ